MLATASIFAHIGLGIVLALFFVIYYVNGEGEIKLFVEILLGLGGNAGAIFILYKTFNITDPTINLLSMAACLFSFVISTILFVAIFAHLIKDKENSENQIIRLRDIILGQTAWIKNFRDKRMKEIDEKLNYEALKHREDSIKHQEDEIVVKKKLLEEEIEKFNIIKKKKVCLNLPENHQAVLSKEFVELMPSYFKDVVRCIIEINALEKEYLEYDNIDINLIKSYLFAIATSISSNIFNNNSGDIRIHFRYFNKSKNGYDKLIAIKGNQIVSQKMTFIPYEQDNMINRSFESKRALIKSINVSHDYKSDNNAIWKEYLTYTFHNVKSDDIPYLSFGISLKNETRYKNMFYYLNYINFFEEYLHDKIEKLHIDYNMECILYGGNN